MTITVEDGSIVTGANSYAAVVDLASYAELRGICLDLTTAQSEAYLIQAMDYIHDEYGTKFQGDRIGSTQELDFPRTGVRVDEFNVDSDEIPRHLIYGQLSKAIELSDPATYAAAPANIKREKLDGVFEVEYANDGKVLPVSAFARSDALLRPLCKASGMLLVRS